MAQLPWRLALRVAAGTATAALLLYLLRGVWPSLFLALVLTYLLAPAVDYLHSYGMRRSTAILLLYLLIALVAAVALVYLLPGFVEELNRLGRQLPAYSQRVRALVEGVRQDAARATLPASVRAALLEELERAEAWVSDRIAAATGGIMDGVLAGAPLLLAPVMAFYLLNDLDRLRRWVRQRLSGRRRRWLDLLHDLDQVLAGFIRGQLLVAGFVGLLVTLVAAWFRLRFPVLLGLVATLTDLIPYLGPILGAVPVLAMAALQSPATALKVALALLLIQWVENSVLAPRILGKRVGLHPLVVIVALLVAGNHFGLVGLLLAVPVAGLIHVLLNFFWPQWMGSSPREDVGARRDRPSGEPPAAGRRGREGPAGAAIRPRTPLH